MNLLRHVSFHLFNFFFKILCNPLLEGFSRFSNGIKKFVNVSFSGFRFFQKKFLPLASLDC